jgi:hypothetical protein
MHMSTACAVTAPVPEPPGHRLNGKDTDDLHNIHEDLEDSLMLEGRDMQALSCVSSRIEPGEPANNIRKRTNNKRPRTTKHARKLAVATLLAYCRADPKP